MVVVKPLQKGAENGMFGHPAGNSFAHVSSRCWLLNDKTYCCVVTRNGPSPQVLEDMRMTMELSCSAMGRLIKIRSILERVRMTPRAVESLLV